MKNPIRSIHNRLLALVAVVILAVTQRLGLVVLRRDQINTVLILLAVEERRLRRLGGGNASKVRDPRKSLRRLVQRLSMSLSHVASRTTPIDPAECGPKALRAAARKQIKGVSDA